MQIDEEEEDDDNEDDDNNDNDEDNVHDDEVGRGEDSKMKRKETVSFLNFNFILFI